MNFKKKKTIRFRADGDLEIGLGHLIRCQSLAEMIKNNYNIIFYSSAIPVVIEKDLIASGFAVHRMDAEAEFFNSLRKGDGVVVDGYSFETAYHQEIMKAGCRLILLDDLYDRTLCADLIINPAPGVTVNNYSLQPDCPTVPIFAMGPDYALLRPAFLNIKLSYKVSSSKNNLLICFGGSDVKNLTEKVLQIAIDFNQFKKITIITGSANPNYHNIKHKFSDYNHLQFFHALDDAGMAEKLAETDIAVVPASGMLVEALSMQRVVISGMYIENQKNMYGGFKKLNAFVDAGLFETEQVRTALEHAVDFIPETIIDRKSPGRYRTLFEQILH